MMGHRERIGKRIAELRASKGYTVRRLAELSGVNYTNIGKIENGRYNVSIDILGKICEALGCRIDLVCDKENFVLTKGQIKTLLDVMPELKNDCDSSFIKEMMGNIDKKRADYFYKPSIPGEKPKEVLRFNSKKEEQIEKESDEI